ncbi:hypothetical protein FRC12_016887 [Ceratobasidium sp. 428]|nr:hypothetical protein FRC12_016887 [Ceratobasidium sp. 428]
MKRNFFDRYYDPKDDVDHPRKVAKAKKSIDLLVKYGAIISRWKSLTVSAWVPQILYEAIGYVHPTTAPSLRFLSLEWKTRLLDWTIDEEDYSFKYYVQSSSHSSGPVEQFTQLRCAHFNAVPPDFIFKQPQPILVGLTHLKIASAFRLFSLAKLYTLLSASPQLESLEVTTGFADDENIGSSDLQVVLLSLHTLSLSWNVSSAWALGIMKMIDCPTIKHLQLDSVVSKEEILQLACQIIDRNYRYSKPEADTYIDSDTDGSDLPTSNNQEVSLRQHIYPALRSLDISKLVCHSRYAEAFRELLTALPTIEFLAAPDTTITQLGRKPWLLPHLERIKVFGQPPVKLNDILRRRIQGGLPVKILEIQEQYLPLKGRLPKSLNVVKLPPPTPTSEYESYDDVDSDPAIAESSFARNYRGRYDPDDPDYQLARLQYEEDDDESGREYSEDDQDRDDYDFYDGGYGRRYDWL